jgi:hypothetical protein
MSTQYPSDEIPDYLSLNLAAKLFGLSPGCFREGFITTGQIEYSPDGLAGRWYVDRASLERALGRRIEAAEYQAADRALAPRRTYQKQYRRFNRNVHAIR